MGDRDNGHDIKFIVHLGQCITLHLQMILIFKISILQYMYRLLTVFTMSMKRANSKILLEKL